MIVGHKFKGTNAFSRLYFEESSNAINSSNDSIENLMDTLEIDGIKVYILDVEGIGKREQNLVVYKLTKDEIFNNLKDEAEHKFLEKVFEFQV